MRRHLTLFFSVVLIAGLSAFCVGYFITGRGIVSTPADLLQNQIFLTKTLRLDDDQQQKLADLEMTLRKRVNEGCARNCAARRRLAAALKEKEPDPKILDEILKDMCGAYEDSERTALEHIQNLRGMLDDEQCRTFDAMIGRCLCGASGKGCPTAPVLE